MTLAPWVTERVLLGTATNHPCPVPALIDYSAIGRDPSYNAWCVGTAARHNIWGEGIVAALRAVRHRH